MIRNIALIAFCLVAVPSFAQEKDQVSLKDLKDRSVDALDDIKTYRAEDVLDGIRSTMEQFNDVSQKMLSAPPGDEERYIDELIEFYEDAAENYSEIIDQKDEISLHVQQRRNDLDTIMRDARDEIRLLERKSSELGRRPNSSDEFLMNVEEQQRKTLKSLYAQQIHSVEVWLNRYDGVVKNAGALTQAIERLLYVIELTIPIYEQSARTLAMNRDLKNALELFESQEEIDGLTDKLITSWGETEMMISDALKELGSAEILP